MTVRGKKIVALLTAAFTASASAEPIPFAQESKLHFDALTALLSASGRVAGRQCLDIKPGDQNRICTFRFNDSITVFLVAKKNATAFHEISITCHKMNVIETAVSCRAAALNVAFTVSPLWKPEKINAAFRAALVALVEVEDMIIRDGETRMITFQRGNGSLMMHFKNDARR